MDDPKTRREKKNIKKGSQVYSKKHVRQVERNVLLRK